MIIDITILVLKKFLLVNTLDKMGAKIANSSKYKKVKKSLKFFYDYDKF